MAPTLSKLWMLNEEQFLIIMSLMFKSVRRRKRRQRRWWVHHLWQNRKEHGIYYHLVQELLFDEVKFKEYFRLSREQFAGVLHLVEESLVKKSRFRDTICPRQRLSLGIRFLATGESFRSLAFCYRMGPTTVGQIVSEVCQVLSERLSSIYLKAPVDSDHWKLIADNFYKRWNFPHCLGALDGKHIVMKCPPKTGSLYFNYKGSFSSVLLALVDANYKFIAIDVGAYGRNSDGGIFANSILGKSLKRQALHLPEDSLLPDAPHLGRIPYVIVADEAFPLQKHLMRPFPGKGCSLNQQLYNYRLSRARRIVENAFGILAVRWRVFHSKIAVRPELTNQIVKASCALHNMLQTETTPAEVTTLLQEAATTQNDAFEDLNGVGNRASGEAERVRNVFMDYFCTVQPLSWQLKYVHRGMFHTTT